MQIVRILLSLGSPALPDRCENGCSAVLDVDRPRDVKESRAEVEVGRATASV